MSTVRVRHGGVPRVLMLGPAIDAKGGMASVAAAYVEAWDRTRYELRVLGTVTDSPTRLHKLLTGVSALVRTLICLIVWRPQIVHIHFAWNASFYRKSVFVLLGKLFGKRIIFHCHASRFDIFYESHGKLNQRFILLVLRAVNAILLVSDYWKEYFSRLPHHGTLHTLHNPVALPFNVEHSTKASPPIVLTLGRLGQRKGTYDTLKAIPRVLEQFPTAEFWLGGDGEIEQVEELVAQEPWHAQVKLLGWVTGAQKKKCLSSAAIFLLPSYNEGLPMAILEAMAYHLPVVSTVVGGIPEAVEDGKTGFLIQPGDTVAIANRLTLLLGDAQLRAQIGSAGRAYAMQRFEVGHILNDLYAIYDELLGVAPPQANSEPSS